MNAQAPLTDDMIRGAIARRVAGATQGDVRERILTASTLVRQRRAWSVSLERFQVLPRPGIALRLSVALLLLAVAALIAALVGNRVEPTHSPLGALAYLSGGDLYVASADGEVPRQVWDIPANEDGSGQLVWLDSETLLLQVDDALPQGGVYVVNVNTEARRRLDAGRAVAVSPDRRRVVIASTDLGTTPQERLRLIEIEGGAIVSEIAGDAGSTLTMLSPDGRSLVGASTDAIYRVDVISGERTVLVTGLCCGLASHAPTWSPDGTRVAYVDYHLPSLEPGPKECVYRCGTLWTVSAAGGAPTRVTPEVGSEVRPAFSPDGSWIAYIEEDSTGDGRLNELVVVAADGTGRRVLTPSTEIPRIYPRPDLMRQRFAWDPDSGGLTYVRFGGLWHITLDGRASRVETPLISEFAWQVVP